MCPNYNPPHNLPSFFENEADRVTLNNSCTINVSFALGNDKSYSMTQRMENGRTRDENAIDHTEEFLLKMQKNETMAENVHLFLYTFGGDNVTCIVAGEALCNVDVKAVCQKLRSIPCSGRTPMGRCITEMLDKMEAVKRSLPKDTNYAQPILSIIGDGLPTDDMSEAKRRIHAAMEQDQQKLLFLPLGIGDPGTKFEVFEELLEHDRFETPVVHDAAGLRMYFKLLNKTIRQVEQGQFITPATHFGQIRTILQNTQRAGQTGGDS